VEVALDGEPWRTLPAEVVLRAGLDVGMELDRARARRVGRELRRYEAMAKAAGVLRRRDVSRAELEERLGRADIAPAAREEAVARLSKAGALDDGRFARRRAEVLAERGGGDSLIRHDLATRGIAGEIIEASVALLEPETARAAFIAERRGDGPKTARYLARKGFSQEAIESACPEAIAEDAPPAVR
jgi:regulatory protein